MFIMVDLNTNLKRILCCKAVSGVNDYEPYGSRVCRQWGERLTFLILLVSVVVSAGFWGLGCNDGSPNSQEHPDGGLVNDGEAIPDGDLPEDGAWTDTGSETHSVSITGPLGRIDYEYHLDLKVHDPTNAERIYVSVEGALPPGLELRTHGVVAGTPAESGVYEVVIHGDDDECSAGICRVEMLLEINVAPVILVSGFGPFGGIAENPSWDAVEPLDHELIMDHDIRAVMVPVVWDEAADVFLDEYERLKPVIAVASGVAAGEQVIRLESTAVNEAYGTDNNEVFMSGGPIVQDGAEFLHGTIPLAELESILDQENYPVGISDYAGNYLCNFLYYHLMYHLAEEVEEQHILGGFVHVPGVDVVSVSDMTSAWFLMLEFLAAHRKDLLQKRSNPGQSPYDTTIHHPPRYRIRL